MWRDWTDFFKGTATQPEGQVVFRSQIKKIGLIPPNPYDPHEPSYVASLAKRDITPCRGN
jgi:hypothetical protein